MMHQYSATKLHGFYGDPRRVLVINANPFLKQDIYLTHARLSAVAVSVVLGANGHPIAVPLHAGVTGVQPYQQAIDEHAGTRTSQSLDSFLAQHDSTSIMVDVAGTSPKLINAVTALIKTYACSHRVCCGSRFDAVGEALTLRLPDALHFMPRATRARLTLNLMLDSRLPDVRPFSVINLPMTFEGMKMVTPTLIERMNRMGIRLNVISNNVVEEQMNLAQMSVDGLIVNLVPKSVAKPDVDLSQKACFTVRQNSHQPHCS